MPSSVSVSGKPQYNLTTPLSIGQTVLAGSTTAVRFAGGVNGAIPASGTYAVGDTVVDVTGKIYICTTAGAPGTAVWATVGAGTGLATSNTFTGANTYNNASGLVVQQGGITVTGASSIAGALTVSTGGIAVTGNSTITGTLGGITTLTATTFAGALSGNASTATALQTSRTIQGIGFDGTANITVVTAGTGVSVSGTAVSIGQAVGTASDVTFNSIATIAGKTIGGNLDVNVTTTSVNSTVSTIKDPILSLGGGDAGAAPTVSDAKDRGIEFQWFSAAAKKGFFGFRQSSQRFSFIPDGTNTAEAFSGTLGDIEATTFYGALSGNASTATSAATLTTSRNINGVAFNGSADITVTAAATTLTGTTLNATVTASSLTSVGTLVNLTVTNAISGSITGNAGTATTLQTSRNINGVAFNGSADITVTAAAGTLTGTALNSTVVSSSLTSVGTLTNLTVSDTGTTRVSGLTVLQSITAPNDTTYVTSLTAAHATTTNVDIAIIPKGTGALLASVPDSVTSATTTGGGKRGSSAVDFQQVRSIGTQGGNTQVASGNYSVISGGAYNAASASYATIPGGYGAKAAIYGKFAYASGALSSFGDAQFGMYVLRGTTADQSTIVVLTTDGTGASASNQCVVSSGQVCGYTINLIANGALSGVYGKSAAQWVLEGLVRRDGAANTVTLIGYPNVSAISDTASNAVGAPDLTNCTVTVQADTTNGALQIAVQGPAASTAVKWVAIVQMTEVG